MSKILKRTTKPPDEKSVKKRKRSKKPRETSSELKNERNGSTDPKCASKNVLFSIGDLCQGVLLKRPSKHIKSPYLADVKLDDGGEEVIAWAPMLDLGGLLKPGRVVRMTKSKPGGKSSHAIQLVGVNEVECRSGETTWIGANPNLGNSVAKVLLKSNLLAEPILGDKKSKISEVQSEVKMKCEEDEAPVRSDFVVNEKVVVEVKSCVCADYHVHTAPEVGKKDPYYTVIRDIESSQYQRAGIFPIGRPAKKFEGSKVVSDRCIKHLRHLSKIAKGDDCNGYEESALLIIVNRGDCMKFKPCKEACPVFDEELRAAVAAGVRLVVAQVIWKENGDGIFGGLLPVDLT